jgi:hypothetical protein
MIAVMICTFVSCSPQLYYAPMVTKGYGHNINVADASNINDSNSITKNNVTIIVQPFDVNDYFKEKFFTRSVPLQSNANSTNYFPLVVNLFNGFAVFKITIQNNSPNTYIYYNFGKNISKDEINISYDEYMPLHNNVITEYSNVDRRVLPCYYLAKQLVEKKSYGLAENTSDDANFINTEIKNAMGNVMYEIGNSKVPLLNNTTNSGGISVTNGKNVTGYIVFPEVEKEADLEFEIDNVSYKFRVKPTLQYYKSVYSIENQRYMPYEPITKEQLNLFPNFC